MVDLHKSWITATWTYLTQVHYNCSICMIIACYSLSMWQGPNSVFEPVCKLNLVVCNLWLKAKQVWHSCFPYVTSCMQPADLIILNLPACFGCSIKISALNIMPLHSDSRDSRGTSKYDYDRPLTSEANNYKFNYDQCLDRLKIYLV